VKTIELPKYIDEPPQILMWRIDDLVPVIVLMVIGILANHLLPFLLVGFVGIRFYRRFRESKPDGYFLHALYWYGVFSLRGYAVPNVFARVFIP